LRCGAHAPRLEAVTGVIREALGTRPQNPRHVSCVQRTMTKIDAQLRLDVEEELASDPNVNAAAAGVTEVVDQVKMSMASF
jgi:hypothetical protein